MCGAGTWQMCPKCSEPDDCRKAPSITEGKKKADDSSFLNIPISCSQLSSVSNMSESCAPNLVYRRRKQRGNSVAILSADTLAKTKRSADSLSAVSSEAPLGGTTEQHMGSQVQHELVAIGAPILPLTCNKEPDVLRFESTNKSSVGEEHGTDKVPNNGLPKIVDVDSVNDSCSSSKSNLELISATTEKIEIDDAGECSSSSMLVVDAIGKDLTGKDLFIAILRRQGLLEKVWPPKICASSEGGGICSSSSYYRSCKICSHSETTSTMLICDNCEDAFHLSCYIPRIKIIPVDEWFCHSCVTKKRGIINDTINKKFPSITSEMGRYRSTSSHCEADPIALMLEDTEPYKSDVRVGKGYQAEVPQWEGPVNNDIDTIIESLEMDPSDSMKLQQTSDQHPRRCPIGNWLQCREVRDGPGSDNGTICGKWRRAPLFEVQTDNWECFCSVLWDPTHADCAVPQELETDQVLKQLKYIEMLKPRLSAKRRKLDHTKSDAKTPVDG